MGTRNEMIFENPPAVNRNVIWIEPTAVFLEWARKFPDDDLIAVTFPIFEDRKKQGLRRGRDQGFGDHAQPHRTLYIAPLYM